MGYFPTETYTVGSSFALLWVLYPMTILVGIELFLRAMSNDDDDDDEGGGVMTPVYQGVNAWQNLISIYTYSNKYLVKCIKQFSSLASLHIFS